MAKTDWIENCGSGSLVEWVANTLTFARHAVGQDYQKGTDDAQRVLAEHGITSAAYKVDRDECGAVVLATIALAHEIVTGAMEDVAE